MSDTTDETPKKTIAKRVITPKRKYFSPVHGAVEAKSLEDAVSQIEAKEADKTNTKEQVGDAN